MIHDEFATWDAAYVLGSLSPGERKQFEEHLHACDSCSAAVAELAGMPGLLSRVPREQAFALLDEEAPSDAGLGAEVLPSLLDQARRRRWRSRWLVGGLAAVAAAVLVGVLAIAIPAVIPTSAPGSSVAMEQVEPSALSADLRLTSEPWGTRIDSRCTYAKVGGDDGGRTWTYAMVVTDRSGHQTQISTWSAAEGSTVAPIATTSVPLADIASVDIRAAANGTVLLRSTFG
ncbi:anti-sigma factor [Leifsonia sp. TF02-11]|uniref:anti-sigma factor family protein n=1 Tax=Leifsonia sp. TF02-11 TaxID=2815212 RepID=UPI001AA17139|nr:zf-HC2 domain-containing protein [Leifsonia sp. TF02-11]MBO1741160.1 zf-HC2 domain-containing protein [Leifsonia sp. TF02-11]